MAAPTTGASLRSSLIIPGTKGWLWSLAAHPSSALELLFLARGSPELCPAGIQPQRGYPGHSQGWVCPAPGVCCLGGAAPALLWFQTLCAQGNELEQGIQNDSQAPDCGFFPCWKDAGEAPLSCTPSVGRFLLRIQEPLGESPAKPAGSALRASPEHCSGN